MHRKTVAESAELGLDEVFRDYVGRRVVLDTARTVVFLGTLTEVSDVGFWLSNADIHDCQEGHADRESYVYEAKIGGIRTNRRRLFVSRAVVISVSALDDVVQEDLGSS